MCALHNLQVGASPSSSPVAGRQRGEELETKFKKARDDVVQVATYNLELQLASPLAPCAGPLEHHGAGVGKTL